MPKLFIFDKFLRESKTELDRFKKTNDTIYLYQAGEKIWGAFSILIEHISKKEIKSHKGVGDEAEFIIRRRGDFQLEKLFYLAELLHEYFYEGRRRPKFVIGEIEKAHKLLSVMRARYFTIKGKGWFRESKRHRLARLKGLSKKFK